MDGWQDGQSTHLYKQECFLKIVQTGLPFSNSVTSPGASAVLTPRLDSGSHFRTGFPALELTPLKGVLLTPQKVTWNSNLFFPLLKAFQQFPVARRKKATYGIKKFSMNWLLPISRSLSTQILPSPLHSSRIELFVIPTTPQILQPPYLCCFLCLLHFSSPSLLGELLFVSSLWLSLDIRSLRKSPLMLIGLG